MRRVADIETEPAIDADFRRTLANPEAEAALRCAAVAARRYWLSQSAFRASVVSVDSDVELYERALHQFERRTVSLHTAAGGSRHSLEPIPDPVRCDPWAVDPATIEVESRVTAVCPTCDGTMRVTCGNCDGTTRARCGNCGGSGKTYSQRKGQMYKNCPRCRGGGTVKCTSCRGGLVDCTRCGATGVITAWLSVERTLQAHVRVHPQNAASAVHTGLDSAANFDAATFANTLTSDTGTQSPTAPLPSELAAVVNPRTDRLQSTRLQAFSGRVYHVCFATAVAVGQVDVAGRPPAVASTTNWQPLRWRRSSATWASLLGLCIAARVRFAYTARHEWYERFGGSAAVLSLGCAAAICLGWLVARVMRAPHARSGFGLYAAAGLFLGAAAMTGIAFVHVRPTAASARVALARGVIDDSRLEARALIDLDLDRAGGEAVLDEIQSRLVASAPTCHEMAPLVSYEWRSAALREQSTDRLRSCAVREAASAFAAGNASALSMLASDVFNVLPVEAGGVHWMRAVIYSCEALTNDDLDAAIRNLDDVSSLARGVPPVLRLANFQQVVDAAATLRPGLAAAQTGSARARKNALPAAIERTDALVALLPPRWPQASTALTNRLQKLRKPLARAERKAADHADDATNAEQASPAPAPSAPERLKGDLMDPY